MCDLDVRRKEDGSRSMRSTWRGVGIDRNYSDRKLITFTGYSFQQTAPGSIEIHVGLKIKQHRYIRLHMMGIIITMNTFSMHIEQGSQQVW